MFIGLFYNSIEKEIFAEMALKEASRINIMEAAKCEGNNLETATDDPQPSNTDAKNIKEKYKEHISEPIEIQNREVDNRIGESDKAQESLIVDNLALNSKNNAFSCRSVNSYPYG